MFQVDLIEKCRRNDRKAQLQLYKQYCDAMYNVAYRFVKDAQEAEDVCQEAFIKAFQRLHQYKAEVTFGAWLKRIVVNQSIDKLKARKLMLSTDDVVLEVVEDDNWMVEDKVTMEEIKTAIETLPEKYRYVVMLYLMEGYDHAEIAQILGIAETTSRTQLLRGKQKLQALLKHRYHGTGY